VVLSAQDSDVIKTYVELGSAWASSPRWRSTRSATARCGRSMRATSSSRAHAPGIKRGAYLRRYAYEFIELFAPHLPKSVVERAVRGEEGSRYEL